MSSFHTTTDASFFPCGENQTAAWTEVAGQNQQATLSFNGGTPGPLTSHILDQIFAPVLDDMVKTGFGLDAASAGAFNPGYTPNMPEHYNHMNTVSHATWLAPTPPLTDSDTIASPQSDAPWDGSLLPTPPAPGPQGDAFPSSSVATIPASRTTSARPFEPGHSAHLTTPYVDGNGGMSGPYLNFPSTVGATPWATPLGAEKAVAGQAMTSGTYVPTLPRTRPGKRPHDAEGTGHDFIQATNGAHRSGPTRRVKRKMRRNGVLEAAGSTSRARQEPADRTPADFSAKSEAAGRGAGMLAAPIAHEVYHQFLPGPSVQGALTGTTAQEQLPWVEGSVESMGFDFTGSAVGQLDVVNTAEDGEGEDAEEDGFKIPKGLDERYQRLLMATPEERARGVVRVLKCVICPKAGFSKWDNFTRHCDRTEAHPVTFVFCRFCGDFFSRPEARKRHEESPPKECSMVSPAKAEEKRAVTLRVHEEYTRELDAYLKFGGTMGESFIQRIIKLYPDSSKRGSRQQNRLKA